MPSLRKPRALKKGDTIAIIAPAGPVDPDRLAEGEAMLEKMGFATKRRADLLERTGYLAGDDERRADEFMEFVRDPEVHALLCARGGYGSQRILDRLDADEVRRQAKPLIGYSDITTLLLWQRRRAGLMGFHSAMLERPNDLTPESKKGLLTALLGMGPPARISGKSLIKGWGEGRLTGGSLAMVTASLGTPWEIETRGAILLIEETHEAPYRIDRMLTQLRLAGKLADVVGIGVGCLAGCENDVTPLPGALDVIEEIAAPLGIPVVCELPFGHTDHHLTWPLGARAAIDGDRGEIELLELGVAKR